MKTKKIKLEDIKVKSFTTTAFQMNFNTVKGGSFGCDDNWIAKLRK